MYSCQSLFVPVYACAARRGCTALAGRRPADPVSDLVSPACCRVTVSHVTATVFKRWARFLVTSQVRRCSVKIDSAMNIGEKPSTEFIQCEL